MTALSVASTPTWLRVPEAGAAAPAAAAPAGALGAVECSSGLCAIETHRLRKRFGSNEVLTGVDLAIPEGSLAAVLGPSGTGKSVLLGLLIGLLPPDAGEVLVRGRRLCRMSRSEVLALRRDIGVMFQEGALFGSMSVFENVAFPLRQHTDLNEAEIAELAFEQLEAVGLADAAERYPAELSGGMKKRAGLARALVLDPGIVLCDEPDSGLDPVRTSLLGELLLDRHADRGGTMVIVTHDIALARLVADHVSILWQGRIVQSGPSADVFASNDPFVRQLLAGDTAGPLRMDA